MWELLTKKEPYSDMKVFEIPGAVVLGKRPEIPHNSDPDFVKLIKACWSQKPENRPSFIEIEEILKKLIEIKSKK